MLPICGKIFERLIYNNLFEYFIENDLISRNQSGFKPDDSCINDRKQRVDLNGQHSKWASIEAGVSQGSILCPLLFLIYINDLPDNLISNSKLFADDASLFSVINDKYLPANKLRFE